MIHINWVGYQYDPHDGYGRYGTYMVQALQRAGAQVVPLVVENLAMPTWMLTKLGFRADALTISCLPPYLLRSAPSARHWLLSMTEGSELPDGWAASIAAGGVERVIVPCRHNAAAFGGAGLGLPIDVVPGGTDPDAFPVRAPRRHSRPYTFLALADRGERKGWFEVYNAFYAAFGGSKSGVMDVRLIFKSRPDGEKVASIFWDAENADRRLVFQAEDVENVADVYAQADCVVIPSRSEGWGMPHREAAMMGLPVITQRYSGLDDGHTEEWAIVVEGGHLRPIPADLEHVKGEWLWADKHALAAAMLRCYHNPIEAARRGQNAARWLREHQTWDHAATTLLERIRSEVETRQPITVLPMEVAHAAG